MFSSKFVKIAKVDWELRELEYNELLEEVATLRLEKEELEKTQSDFLMGIVKKQSAEIAKLLKYKEQDDILFSYEQSNDEKNEIIKNQKSIIKDLEATNKQLLASYQKEANMNTLLSRKIIDGKYDCETYKTVSTFQVRT